MQGQAQGAGETTGWLQVLGRPCPEQHTHLRWCLGDSQGHVLYQGTGLWFEGSHGQVCSRWGYCCHPEGREESLPKSLSSVGIGVDELSLLCNADSALDTDTWNGMFDNIRRAVGLRSRRSGFERCLFTEPIPLTNGFVSFNPAHSMRRISPPTLRRRQEERWMDSALRRWSLRRFAQCIGSRFAAGSPVGKQ